MTAYAKWLEDLIAKRELSQRKVSKIMGVSQICINQWSRGTMPTRYCFDLLCDKLQLSELEKQQGITAIAKDTWKRYGGKSIQMNGDYVCPCCCAVISQNFYNYCPNCGQRIEV